MRRERGLAGFESGFGGEIFRGIRRGTAGHALIVLPGGHVERYLREVMIAKLAPVSPQLVLCFIAEKVLGLPKSY